MRIRRSVLFSVLLLLVTAGIAQAYMPIALENVIKTWFNSAGKLIGFRIYESPAAPAVSGTNNCRLYVDATSNSLMASCGTKAYTYLVGGSATTPCTQDINGNMTCNTFISVNQDPTAANAIRLRSNDSGTARTCATAGTADQLTIIDKAAGATETWCFCNGATELSCLN